MNENDITKIFLQDGNLREAVRRHDDKLPPTPDGLNELVMQRVRNANTESNENRKVQSRWIWLMAFGAAAATILLFLYFIHSASDSPKPSKQPFVLVKQKEGKEKQPEQTAETKSENEDLLYLEKVKAADLVQIAKAEDTEKDVGTEPVKSQSKRVDYATNKIVASRQKQTAVLPKSKQRKEEQAVQIPPKPLLSQRQTEKTTTPTDDIKKTATSNYPDTLGSQIFQSPENVRMAMSLLSETDETIRRETQEIRNYVIESTFAVVPSSPNAILVKDEYGDLNVMETGKARIVEL